MSRYQGKIVLITGSTEGIGHAIAHRMAKEGAHVIITSRTKKKVDAVVKEIKSEGGLASGFAADITDASQRKELVKFAVKIANRIDALVVNAALISARMAPLLEQSDEEWDTMMHMNVKVAWQLVKEIVQYIPSNGSILFIGSIAGYRLEAPNALYGISKTSLSALSIALSQELAPKGIRVNNLASGPTLTAGMKELKKTNPAFVEKITSTLYLKRLADPHELGSAAAFLCSTDASFITGETVVAAGGYRSRL